YRQRECPRSRRTFTHWKRHSGGWQHDTGNSLLDWWQRSFFLTFTYTRKSHHQRPLQWRSDFQTQHVGFVPSRGRAGFLPNLLGAMVAAPLPGRPLPYSCLRALFGLEAEPGSKLGALVCPPAVSSACLPLRWRGGDLKVLRVEGVEERLT